MNTTLMALLWTAATAGGTEVATWTDAEGVTHFSDRPPALHYQRVQIRAPNGADPYPTDDLRTVASTSRAGPRIELPTEPDPEHAEACFRARLNLETLQDRRRSGYRLADVPTLDEQEARYRAEERFYCR